MKYRASCGATAQTDEVWAVLRRCAPNKGLRTLALLCSYPRAPAGKIQTQRGCIFPAGLTTAYRTYPNT